MEKSTKFTFPSLLRSILKPFPESNRWYQIRLKVTKDKIEAWIDKKQVVDLKTTDRQLGIRWTCEPSLPFGIATWQTGAAYRSIQLRELAPRE